MHASYDWSGAFAFKQRVGASRARRAQPGADQSFLDMPRSGISYLYGAMKKRGMTKTG